jgi:hypothetical protein
MAITSYSELQTAIANWPNRADTTFTNRVPEFITLFEDWFNRNVRVRPMQAVATLTPSSGIATVPSDFLSAQRLTWTGSPRSELEYQHPSYIQAAFPDTPSGTPQFYTIEGSSTGGSRIKVRPTSDTDLELGYYQKLTPLSTSATTNWLLDSHRDIYLYGSLAEAVGFIEDTAQLSIFKAQRDERVAELLESNKLAVGTPTIRIVGVVA